MSQFQLPGVRIRQHLALSAPCIGAADAYDRAAAGRGAGRAVSDRERGGTGRRTGLKSRARKGMWVRFPPLAPIKSTT